MKRKMNRKGISLIVLVITIIVIIILAVAVILTVSNNNPVEKANKAVTDSDSQTLKEAATLAYSEIILENNGKLPQNATALLQSKLNDRGLNGDSVVITEEGKIEVGVSKAVSEIIKQNVPLGAIVEGYNLEKKTYKTSGIENNGRPQSLTTYMTFVWRYVGIENGKMLIAPDMPDDPVYARMTLSGYNGYLYGAEELNKVCKEIYSTSKGEARSINIDDITNILKYKGPKGAYCNETSYSKINTDRALTIEEFGNDKITNTMTPTGKNSWDDIKHYLSDAYDIPIDSPYINSTDIAKSLVFYDTDFVNFYWIASPGNIANLTDSTVDFEMRWCTEYISSTPLAASDGYEGDNTGVVRPIVTINNDIGLTYNTATNTCVLE